MRLFWTVGIGSLLAMQPATAGIYTDDFSRCLVEKTSADDKVLLIRWIFATASVGPAVQKLSNVTDEQRAGFNKLAAELFTRLMTESCHQQFVAAVRNEGLGAIDIGFNALGNVAGRGLLADPAVAAEAAKMAKLLDQAKMTKAMDEAGISKPEP